MWPTPNNEAPYNQMAAFYNYYQLQQHLAQPGAQQFLEQLLAAQSQYVAQLSQAEQQKPPPESTEKKPEVGPPKPLEPEVPKKVASVEMPTPKAVSSRKAPSKERKKAAEPMPVPAKRDAAREDSFDLVQGRLAMGTNNTKYYVTREEMQRRLEGPENLNSSSLACNLKRPKLKNGGELMRAQIKELGIRCRLNTRQAVYPNKLIGMCEGEVVNMVNDLSTLCTSDYPSEQIGREVVEECGSDDEATQTAINEKTDDFLECMKSLKSCMELVMPPITGLEPKACKDGRLNEEMEKFSCVTHGYGPLAQKVWLDQLTDIGKAIASTKKK